MSTVAAKTIVLEDNFDAVRDAVTGDDLMKIAEAGGFVETQDADAMMRNGGRVVVGTPIVFDRLLEISQSVFAQNN